jgi:hypothetical protein
MGSAMSESRIYVIGVPDESFSDPDDVLFDKAGANNTIYGNVDGLFPYLPEAACWFTNLGLGFPQYRRMTGELQQFWFCSRLNLR